MTQAGIQTLMKGAGLQTIEPGQILILCNLDGVMIEPEPEAHIAAHLDALRDIFGVDIYREEFWKACENGLTDRAIAQRLLKYRGINTDPVSSDQVDRWLMRIGELFVLYTALNEYRPVALPHVKEGLARAISIRTVQLALATGNVERIARTKLKMTELDDFFPPDGGGFGDNTLKRTDLIRDALISSGWDAKTDGERQRLQNQVYLLGDTVHDMTSAKELGIHTVGVATGGCGRAELENAGAEAVFLRFDRAIEWILGQTETLWTATL